MKFVAKEKPEVKLELGDVVEYKNSTYLKGDVVRVLIIKGYDINGEFGYLAFNLERSETMWSVGLHYNLESMYNTLKGSEGLRIIKSSNLELREV